MYNKLDSNYPKAIQPENVSIELKEHQKTALYAMKELENNGFIKHKELTIETNIGF